TRRRYEGDPSDDAARADSHSLINHRPTPDRATAQRDLLNKLLALIPGGRSAPAALERSRWLLHNNPGRNDRNEREHYQSKTVPRPAQTGGAGCSPCREAPCERA